MDQHVAQLLQGLGFFKDWTNYLLVTTVAALGWIATKPVLVIPPRLLAWTIACFCFSIIFAIFTLALIPIVAENCQKETTSIYDVAAPFKPIWLWGETVEAKLKWACWPQHVFFLAGIILFSVGSFFGALRAKPAEEKREVWIALPAPSAPHQVAQLPLSWWRLLRTND